MKANFDVRVLDFEILKEIKGAWSSADFASLLQSMDFGETSAMKPGEMLKMALLALQDFEPTVAAELVLTQHLGHTLSQGQIRNAANEMLDEKLWEEYADLSVHEGMFNVASVLFKALPQVFPEPDAVKISLEVRASNQAGQQLLSSEANEPFLVRLLAGGMDNNSILHRLFEDQLNGLMFPEADNIVWIWDVDSGCAPVIEVKVTSSGYWLDALRDAKSYSCAVHFDK